MRRPGLCRLSNLELFRGEIWTGSNRAGAFHRRGFQQGFHAGRGCQRTRLSKRSEGANW